AALLPPPAGSESPEDMFHPDQYQLLDFGGGRRLERFGPAVVDRPCPAVEREPVGDPAAWGRADARFVRPDSGKAPWQIRTALPEPWTVRWQELVLELKPTPAGQVGLFPEQAANWDWLRREGAGRRLLNLFAYTGGSTLAAVAAGAEVTHVDAAGNIVAWAQRNAERSGLGGAPIRWITEDVVKFVKRELKRGRRYEGVILDPPSYGHGRRGEVWRLTKHLARLLAMCAELTAGRRRLMLMTCHTPGYEAPRLRRMLAEAIGQPAGTVSAAALSIPAADDRCVKSGSAAWWPGE
ncbi:MAG: class I SAM-dependent methyltransferase, partial [Pirellulales bacterium]